LSWTYRPASTIDQVIDGLEEIIQDAYENGSRLGFFPTLYQRTTIRVKEGIAAGLFENPGRMERLDALFANHYLEAYAQYRGGEQPVRAWAYTFEMAQRPDPMILQHLMLGMNAHISLDLGIAAAATAPGEQLPSLRRDFLQINEILSHLVDDVQDRINTLSPRMRLLDTLGWRIDELICDLTLAKARAEAWAKAGRLAQMSAADIPAQIDAYDLQVARFAATICPERRQHPVVSYLRRAEAEDVRLIIDTLRC
jgi:hypothetical protein